MAKKATKSTESILGNVFGVGKDLINAGASIISGSTSSAIRKTSQNVEVDDVLNVLEELIITDSQCSTEKNIEKIISTKLDDYFKIHRQYSIGGFISLKIDIDVNETVGIELKLAKELKTVNIERLLGQVLYYSRRKYKSKLLVVIVGTTKDENNRIIEELQDIIEEQGVNFYFLKTVKSRKI